MGDINKAGTFEQAISEERLPGAADGLELLDQVEGVNRVVVVGGDERGVVREVV